VRTLLTGEDLLELQKQGRFELVRGELVELTPPGFEHGEVAGNVYYALKSHARARNLGKVVVESGFYLQRGPDTVRGPDVSFYAWDRIPDREQRQGYAPRPPNLVVEVVSPQDTAQDLEIRIQEFLGAGVERIWVLFPASRTLRDVTSDGTSRVLQEDDTLTGEPQLPGFSARVRQFFED
jgi:Uma2 family endonuclease